MKTKTQITKQILSIFLCFVMLLTYVPMTAFTAVSSAPPVKGDAAPRIEARGTPITIEAGTESGKTVIWYGSSSNKTYVTDNGAAGEDLSDYVIYAGYYNLRDSDDAASTGSITMTGGSVKEIVAANLNGIQPMTAELCIIGGQVQDIYFSSPTGVSSGKVCGLITVPAELYFLKYFTQGIYKSAEDGWVLIGSAQVPAGENITIAEGETLTVDRGEVLTNNGTIRNSGSLIINGSFANNGTVENTGTITRNAAYIVTDAEGTVTVLADGKSVFPITERVDGKLYLYDIRGRIKATLNGTDYCGIQTDGSSTQLTEGYGMVTDISGIPQELNANHPTTLAAVLFPAATTFDTEISYTLTDVGTTQAVLSGNVLTAYNSGTVELLAVATDGVESYSETFMIPVTYTAVTGLSPALPASVIVGSKILLPKVTPTNSSYQEIQWSILSGQEETGATIADGYLVLTKEGTATVQATVKNGKAYGVDYTQTFTVTAAGITGAIDIGQGSVTIDENTDGSLRVTYSAFSGGYKDYGKNEWIVITGSSDTNKIYVCSGNPNIALSDCSITQADGNALALDAGTDAALTLVGENVLNGYNYPGIYVPVGAAITIGGEGSLIATGGGDSAGIGGRFASKIGERDIAGSGTITINSGTVTAKGGTNAAGIGAGSYGSNGTVIINGGVVTATGGIGAAGIGGGEINSNTVYTTGGTVIINGGFVTATGGNAGAGIGGGYKGSGGNVTITGGTVIANGGYHAAGIGGGRGGSGGTVVISGGNVFASKGDRANDIGAGYDASGITLKDANGNSISKNTITLDGAAADTAVTAAVGLSYGLKDVKTLNTNQLYFYLPSDAAASSITASGTLYDCTNDNQTYYASHDWSNGNGVCVRCGETCEHENQTGSTCEICGKSLHTHSWTYTQDGNKLTATCNAAGCPNEDGGSVTISATGKTYDGTAVVVSVVKTGILENTDIPVTLTKDSTAFTGDPVNAGAYTASITLGDATVSVNFTIAPVTITADMITVAEEIYNGETQIPDETVTVGGVTLVRNVDYSVQVWPDDNYYRDAGEWEFFIHMDMNPNYTGETIRMVQIINKATPTVTAPTAKINLIYDGSEQALINEGSTTGGTLQYSLDNATWSAEIPTAIKAGTYTVYYKVVGGDNYEDVAAQSITVTIADKTLPTGTILIKENGWSKFWNTITFGIFFKDYVDVTITADGTGSGVAKVEYLLSGTVLDENNIPDDGWTTLNADNGSYSFSIQPQSKVAVYVRITDEGGNVTVINSDGIVVYEDSEAVTTLVNYTYKENSDRDITVTLNGNTVKSVAYENEALDTDTDYTVAADGTITLKADYLDRLDRGSYTFTISYNPMGVENFGVTDLTTTFIVTVDQATITGADVKVNGSYTYTGSAYTPKPVVTLNGRTLIEGLDYTVSYSNNVNAGTATVTVTGIYNYKDSASTNFTIGKGTPTKELFNVQWFENPIYDGTTTFPVIVTTTASGMGEFTVKYNGGTDVPINAGYYAVTLDVAKGENFNAATIELGAFGVFPASGWIEIPAGQSVTYDGEAITAGASHADILYTYNGDAKVTVKWYADNNGEKGDVISAPTNAGTYWIGVSAAESNNYTEVEEVTASITIAKADYDMSGARLDYNGAFDYDGKSHTVWFDEASLPDGVTVSNYTGNTASTVGKHTANVSLSYADLDNYNYPNFNTILEWEIKNDWTPSEYVVSAPNANGWLNEQFTITPASGYYISTTNTADGVWSDRLTYSVETDNGSVTFYLKNTTDGTISLGKTVTYKIDKTPATGKVEFVERTGWEEFVNNITFGLFYKDEVTVKITANDTLSGVASIEYYATNKKMTLDEVKAITNWTAYNGSFGVNVEDTKQFVYFVRITDKSGNVTYLSTDGAEYDITAPVISGVENGKTYYTTQKVTVTEKNIASITLNGETVGNEITLDGNKDAAYTIVVTDKAGNSASVTVMMKSIRDLSAPIDTLNKNNVNSSNEGVVDSVKAAVAAVDTTNATETEKQALKDIADKAAELEKVIEDTKAEIARINGELNKYDGDTVNSDDAAALEQLGKDIKELTDGGNLTDAERTALTEDAAEVADMLKTIEDTAAENKRISDAVDGYDLTTVTSDDKEDLEQLLADIEEQLESTNLTEEEISELNGDKKAVEDLLTKIKGTDELIDKLTGDVDGYSDDTVKSTDKDAIERIIEDIDALLETENLTEDEEKALEDAKAKAEGLLDTIEDAAKAPNTENTEKVKDVTAENVTPEDKTDLEKAKDDLEKALDEYGDNYTEDEKKAIEDEIKCIDEALEVIGNVEEVEELIGKLPENITKSGEDAIKAADDAYNALSDYEKSLVDKDAKKALDDAKAALAALNKPAGPNSPATGDNSNLWLWVALLFVSGGCLFGITLNERKRKAATKR
ncbi:MAG: hypothetical protein IJ404_01345 [Clostridia bacterium]|nr:hypothetical protein [Clostridia bacterium]MBQ8893234.1 hypothetical protein [Clostridia bacterium]